MTTTLNCIINDIVIYYLKLLMLQKKKLYYDNVILNSKNKMETMWKSTKQKQAKQITNWEFSH